MSNNTDSAETYVGRVKWFNNKAGYGFIQTLGKDLHSECSSEDIFVHHSAIKTKDDHYNYLVQGEYVLLDKVSTEDSKHKYQAVNVRGLFEGPLMCETRHNRSKTGQSNNSEWQTVNRKNT